MAETVCFTPGAQIAVNGKEYTIHSLLGKGKGGYSYLASDCAGKEVVVKQIHHEPCAYYQFGDKLTAELNDYHRLAQLGIPMPKLLEVDREQERLVKEYIPGDTVFELVCQNSLPDAYLHQMEQICCKLYGAGLNIDYFPTNFIPKDDVLYYVDFECNTYMEEWNFENWGKKYWSQTPEFLSYVAEHS